jgi:protein SCO1/2
MALRLALVALLALVLGVLAGLLAFPEALRVVTDRARVPRVEPAAVGGPFSLVDHAGRRVSEKDFRGRYMLMVFGATRSPDITPAGMQLVSAALARLGPRAERVRPVLVTLDPEHDNSAILAAYIARFDRRFTALGGSEDEIAAVAALWHVPRTRVRGRDQSQAYAVDVPAPIYLMGPDGGYVTHFGRATSLDEMVRRLVAELG